MTQPRRWFQIHLSTAVVVMVLASILIFVNVTERTASWEIGRMLDFSIRRDAVVRGWPIPFQVRLIVENREDFDILVKILRVTLNAVIGVIILIVTAIFLEYLIRRRAKI